MTNQKVTGKTVVITGATRGLGLELARGLAANGWCVAGCGRSEASVNSVAEELGDGHCFAVADVSDDRSVAAFSKKVLGEVGAPGLLVNNAAIMNDPAPLWQVGAAEFDALTAVNINGTANVIRHFAPAMIASGTGVIVNLSSGWGRSASPDVAPYCATKWAIEGLSAALAQELPDGLAAVALNPGVIDTDMLRQCWGESASSYDGAPEWASRAVPFLEALGAEDNGCSLTVS